VQQAETESSRFLDITFDKRFQLAEKKQYGMYISTYTIVTGLHTILDLPHRRK